MRRRPAPANRRVFAAILASLWVFGLLGSLWHGRAEEHVYCSEHGTFEEAGPQAANATPPRPSDEASAGDAADERDSHEACAFFDAGTIATLGDGPPVAAVVALAATPLASLSASDAFAPIDLLHLAPKGSPPGPVVSLNA